MGHFIDLLVTSEGTKPILDLNDSWNHGSSNYMCSTVLQKISSLEKVAVAKFTLARAIVYNCSSKKFN